MTVLTLVTKPEEIELVVRCAYEFAIVRDTSLSVLCWVFSPTQTFPLIAERKIHDATEQLVVQVERELAQCRATRQSKKARLSEEAVQVLRALHPNPTTAVLERVRIDEIDFVVAAAEDQTGRRNATYDTNELLRKSPCTTLILFGGAGRTVRMERVLLVTDDGPHARAVASCAGPFSKHKKQVNIVRWNGILIKESRSRVLSP